MDSKHFRNLKETIFQINAIVKSVDPSIKTQVFDLLRPLIVSALQPEALGTDDSGPHSGASATRVRDFYTKHNPDKPAKRVRILAAWIYTQKGSSPFSLKEVEDLFDEVGVGRPNRIDMTLKNALEKGKKLFQSSGHGKYRPTVHGENYFKEKLGVKPPKG
jgi:hypothetical protein